MPRFKLANHTLDRGDNWTFQDDDVAFEDGFSLGTVGVVLRSTIKRRPEDLDAAALAQVDSLTGGIVILGATSLHVTFLGAVTATFPPGPLFYDVVCDFSAIKSFTLHRGTIYCRGDVTIATVP